MLKTQMIFADIELASVVDFSYANFRVITTEAQRLQQRDDLSRSLVFRPAIFQRNDVRWIATRAWRSGAKERGIAALKLVKQRRDPQTIRETAEPIAALIRQLFGTRPDDVVTCVPCGHSRLPDCFGKRLAQSVAEALGLPFLQVFADRPHPGASHPKRSAKLPPLEQIGNPPRSVIVIDDLATSGWHLEETVLALRQLGAAAFAFAWISGSAKGGTPLPGTPAGMAVRQPGPSVSASSPTWG